MLAEFGREVWGNTGPATNADPQAARAYVYDA